MMIDFSFAAPGWLWLLAALPFAACFLRRRSRRAWPWQTLMLACFCLAAARPYLSGRFAEPRRIVLLAEGVAPEALPAETADAEIRPFSGSAALALLETGAELPDGGGTLFLTGPLAESDHSLAAALETLARRRIAVRALPFDGDNSVGLMLRRLDYPPAAGVGASVQLELLLESADRKPVDLAVETGGRIAVRQTALLQPGSQVLPLKLSLPEAGPFRGQLLIDGIPSAEIALEVRQAFPALLFTAAPEGEAAAFREIFGDAVRVDVFTPESDPGDYPLLLFGAGAAERLSPELQREIAGAVADGTGIFAATGREALFSDDKVEEAFAGLFPFSYDGEQENKIPTVALVVIIDTSGSMRGSRIDLARETARLALQNLRENDLAGIVEFHGARRWAAPLQSAANQFSLMRALNRLNAGGGTVILPALSEAYYTLRNANTRLKHVLILTDGGVEYGDFESLIRKMVRNDITVSTVMVGPGESDFLSRLAMWGNGRFFRASSRFALPDLQLRPQGVTPLPPYLEAELELTALASPLTADLTGGLLLHGAVKSRTRDGAAVLLAAGEVPVLATLRTGLGGTAVLNTELTGDWSADLLRHPEYRTMLTAVARQMPDRIRYSGIDVWNRSVNRDLDFEFEVAEARRTLTVGVRPEGGAEQLFTVQAGPEGGFRLRLPGLSEGVYILEVKDFMEKFSFVSRRAPAVSPVPAAERAERINRTAPAEPLERIHAAYPLAPILAVCGLAFLLLQLWSRRRAAGRAMLLFLAAVAMSSANAASYDELLRRGFLLDESGSALEAAGLFRQAAGLAGNDEDREFGEILAWETARKAGILAEWMEQSRPSFLTVAELEENGRYERAWELALELRRDPAADAETILRLAERAGREEWLRRYSDELLADASTRELGFHLAVRRALLAGERAKAEELYRRQLEETAEPEELLELARNAANQALYSVAESALLRAAGPPEDSFWPALFQLVQLYRSTGDIARAAGLLLERTRHSDADVSVLLMAGDLAEQMGEYDAAADLYGRAGAEEAQMRLAMLEEVRGNRDAAIALWRRIALDSPTEMRSLQAGERLIELSRRNDSLEALSAELAEAASPAGAPERLVSLYLRTLLAAGDTETLFAFLEARGLSERMLDYRIELRQYPEAVALLRRDLAERPERRAETLRKLALIAIEMQDRELASECLSLLLADAPADDASRWEFAGAVYMLVGDYRNAASSFDRAARLSPENAELLLLWAKAKEGAGEGREALEMFRSNLHAEVPAERFGVMVDGLLNLNAPREMLQAALEAVLERIEREPENLFYYQLAEDLAEELADAELGRRLERLQLAAAPERRTLLLQKLFLDARKRGDDADTLFYGRILMAFPDRYSPEFYGELGDLLVANGLFIAAERCMRDADHSEGGSDNLLALAETFSSRMLFGDAERIYRELLILTPDRIELLTRYAMMLEFQARYEEAGTVNLKALQLLSAPRAVAGKVSGRGSEQAEFSRRFQSIAAAFANQAILFPEHFTPEIEALRDAAPNPVQQEAWQSLLDRMALLNGDFDRLPTPEKRQPRPSGGPNVPDTVRQLAREMRHGSSDETTAALKAFFEELPERARESAWIQLLEQFDFEPDQAVSACLLEMLPQLQLRGLSADWDMPYAVELKRAYAEQLLSGAPDDPGRQAFAARMRHLSGDGFGARLLAEMLYDEMELRDEITIPDLNSLVELGRIYADAPGETPGEGREALAEATAAWEEKIELYGDTARRSLLLGVLHYAAGDYDRAQADWSRAWDFNRDAYPVFWTLQSAAKESGRWDDWAAVLRRQAPGDQTALNLYVMQLVPYLRTAGFYREARELMSGMNPILQRRERLLLARDSGDRQLLAGEFMGYLRSVREEGGTYALYDQNQFSGGIEAYLEQRNRFTQTTFQNIARQVPECRDYLEYLLQGTFPDQYTFPILWQSLKGMPLPSGRPRTLAMLLLSAADAPDTLTEAEKARLLHLAEHYELNPAVNAAILKLFPAGEVSAAALSLTDRMLNAGGLFPDDAELAPLLEVLAPADRRSVCEKIAATPYSLVRDVAEWRKLKLLQRFAPDLFQSRLKDTFYPVGSLLRLLQQPEAGSCRNHLLTAMEYPDWDNLVQLAGDTPELAALTAAFSEALEELGNSGHLSQAALVRHYALLAAYDIPSRRGGWLEAALRHHHSANEASLWLLDALKLNGRSAEYDELKQRLESEGRYPRIRELNEPNRKAKP